MTPTINDVKGMQCQVLGKAFGFLFEFLVTRDLEI